VSAHAVVVMGSKGARSIGLIKEMIDSQGGTGFSFADMAANRAGILFAEKLLSGQVSLEQLSEGFVVDDYMPSVAGLAEGLQGASLSLEFQNNQGINLNAELEKVEMRVKSLPVHSGRGRAEAAK
jgi:hypothetical protein